MNSASGIDLSISRDDMPSPAYATYWRRKQLLAGTVPHFHVKRWWTTEGLCEIEEIVFDRIRHARNLLDFGAGDLRIMRKLRVAGYTGEYHTLDISPEFEYTFRSLDEVEERYEAILCMDVIEHLTLNEGLLLVDSLVDKLAPGGVLVIQTPNARSLANPMAWDMTHLHCYSIPDLWAYLTALDLEVEGYRVCLIPRTRTFLDGFRHHLKRLVATRVLGSDYADNIVAIARKPK